MKVTMFLFKVLMELCHQKNVTIYDLHCSLWYNYSLRSVIKINIINKNTHTMKI